MTNAAAYKTIPELGTIRFENVTKTFGSITALDNVSVEFAANKINVLLGLSGSGKSTMLRHINGLNKPSTGDVWTLGTPVHAAGATALRGLRNNVGMIFQQFHLVESMSVLENVCTGKLGSLRGPRFGLWSYPRSVRENAMEQLARVGLADKAFQRAGTLSGGQQQRVAIARALIQRPSVLLADEPVASLDPLSSAGVIELLTQISREENLTVICSLHQVQIALEFADRIVGLNAGRVVLDRPAAGLTHNDVDGIYAPVPVDERVKIAV
ncbi:phosphonate ABC transporter ATP-binding protein [Cryobacterium sp. Y11]|uniref:phosphonate ABC transporter ATP-binding protein n=1 Tax=Cryobacterium sp. Y11 TaxID=2045016 RepID=UPI000CE34C3E|nr:phosphonate ABC transporter ATP-binding protein [Cryobacterium sp. Y11]